MKRIKVAQIGTGEHTHSTQVFRSLINNPDVFDMVGFANVDHHDKPLQSVFAGHKEWTAEEILNMKDLDAVVIECDEELQTHYALLAAERGLPMHLEKPCGPDDASFDQLIDLVKEKQLVFHTGYMYRYNPAVQEALEKVHSGALGDIYCVEAHMDCYHPTAVRKWLGNFKGGMMFYLGCHLIDLIVQFMGEPEKITALNAATGTDGLTSEDYGLALMHYKSGVSFAKSCATEPGGFLRRQLVICGSRGTIELLPFERGEGGDCVSTDMRECYLDENGKSPWSDDGARKHFSTFNRYDDMMCSFAAMVRGEKKNPWDYEYERRLHKMVLRACGAIR